MPLRFVPKHKSIVLGLVSTKAPELEDKAALKRRLDEASKFIAMDRLRGQSTMRLCQPRTAIR